MKLTPDKLKNILTKYFPKSLVLELTTEERKGKLRNQVKENWLIAWSMTRALTNKWPDQLLNHKEYRIRGTEKIRILLKIAYSCLMNRDSSEKFNYETKDKLFWHLNGKGFRRTWIGYKWIWEKEEDDVPF